MRAQTNLLQGGHLSPNTSSLSGYIKYDTQAESFSGFPGGRTYYFYCNSTLERSLVDFSTPTFSNAPR